MNFKNMKIEINQDQPLDEVYSALIDNGYKGVDLDVNYDPKMVITSSDGEYHCYFKFDERLVNYKTTTLAELKEMK